MKVINSPGDELSTGRSAAKKKSPFKNTLKKKNGKYTGLSGLIKRGRAQARTYARRCCSAIPEQVAAIESVEAFNGTAEDLYLWTGAAFALGLDDFLDLFRQQVSENAADGNPRNLRRAFQAKLNSRLAALCGKEVQA